MCLQNLMNFHHCLFKILKKNQNVTDGRKDRRMDGRTDNVKTVYAPTNIVCGGIMNQYRKFPKCSDTQNICCNHSKMWTMLLYNESKRCRRNGKQCRPWSDCSSDQTAPWSSLIWVCTVCPGKSVRKLRIIMVFKVQKSLLVCLSWPQIKCIILTFPVQTQSIRNSICHNYRKNKFLQQLPSCN